MFDATVLETARALGISPRYLQEEKSKKVNIVKRLFLYVRKKLLAFIYS